MPRRALAGSGTVVTVCRTKVIEALPLRRPVTSVTVFWVILALWLVALLV